MTVVKTNYKLALLGVLSAFVSGQIIAATSAFSQMSPYIITLSAGPTWENAGESQTLFLSPFIQKTYTSNKLTNTLFDGEVFLGIERALASHFQGQLGLAVAATSNANLFGAVWDDANPLFDNFNDTYNIQHTHIAAKAKVLGDMGYLLKPYVSGSLGVGFNQARNFSAIPTIFAAVPTPNFSSNTTTAFTYTVGLGLERALNTNWRVSAGYEFADWGKSQLGVAPSQTLGGGLSLNHLYTNGMLFGLSYCA